MTAVLDASAVLALVNHESGADVVEESISDSVISAVNYSEIVARLTDRGTSEGEIAVLVNRLRLTVMPFDADDAYAAGLLRPQTRSQGLSLGDRACIALGLRLGYRVLTADRSWADLDLGVEISFIR